MKDHKDPQTDGQYLIGTTFNPSNDDMVAKIKKVGADFIDLIDAIPNGDEDGAPTGNAEFEQCVQKGRLKALARTAVEEASMWAVKAATKPPRV